MFPQIDKCFRVGEAQFVKGQPEKSNHPGAEFSFERLSTAEKACE